MSYGAIGGTINFGIRPQFPENYEGKKNEVRKNYSLDVEKIIQSIPKYPQAISCAELANKFNHKPSWVRSRINAITNNGFVCEDDNHLLSRIDGLTEEEWMQ